MTKNAARRYQKGSLMVAIGLAAACQSQSAPPTSKDLSPKVAAVAPAHPAEQAMQAEPAEPTAPADTPTTPVKLGAPIGQTKLVPLASLARDASKYAKTTIKTEGQVTSVCQAMGCWMEITDQESAAHIRMSGHSFFIPKSATGRRAIVQGTVLARPDQGACEQEAAEATGKTVKVELDATGVELL